MLKSGEAHRGSRFVFHNSYISKHQEIIVSHNWLEHRLCSHLKVEWLICCSSEHPWK